MGTPEFALPSLHILVANGYDIPAVVTTPDKPRGRGREFSPTAVKQAALRYNLPVLQPDLLKDDGFVQQLARLAPDIVVVVAFRILPREVFSIPRLGAFNLHASLLPKYRGAAPINWAIINGETETGVTTFLLQEKVDTGNVLLQARLPILAEDTAGTVHDKLAAIGAEIVLHTVRLLEQGKAAPTPQDDTLASPAPKIFREDCLINWHQPAVAIHNRIRGLSPHPTAFTTHRGKIIKIFASQLTNRAAVSSPGKVFVEGSSLLVSTADALLALTEVCQEGRKRMSAGDFLRGYRIGPDDMFGLTVIPSP